MSTCSGPQQLDELVGQATIKRKARIAIGAALQRSEPLPSTLLTSAGGGLGKTTFARILANEMYAPLLATTGQCISNAADLRNILIRLQPFSILLIDECHTLGRHASEELLVVLEEGVLNVNIGPGRSPARIPVPPFTCIAATTKPSALSPWLRQRFSLHFHFEHYDTDDLMQIAEGFLERWEMKFEDGVPHAIASRSKGIPRIARQLSLRARDIAQARSSAMITLQDFEQAMQLEGIDSLGLGSQERQLLHTLKSVDPRPVAARSLALTLGVEVATVTDVLEPTLFRLGFVTVGGGGRRITASGLAHLDAVEQEAAVT